MSEWSIRLARTEDGEAFHENEENAAELLRTEPSLAAVEMPPSASAKPRCLATGAAP